MPTFIRDEVLVHYEVFGTGFPLVLFAPGGMNSVIEMWSGDRPWIDPTSTLSDTYMVIAMDQRNAGSSSGPISGQDGWATYASDHVALLDHLGLDRVHAMGGCIGSSYVLGLCAAAGDRVSAAVLQNPIGLTADNRDAFFQMFDGWAATQAASASDLSSFRENMFGGDFVFSVSRDFVASCPTPFLVLSGNDHFHPPAVASEIASLAPSAQLSTDWAGQHGPTEQLVRSFLAAHTPA